MQTQTTENSQAAEAPTFEKVWVLMQETDRRIQEIWEKQEKRQAEVNRQMKETDLKFEESRRRAEILDKKWGELYNRFGEIVEYMVAPNLCDKFREMGLVFLKANNNTRVRDYENDIHFEIDIMLENGNIALLAEVKTKLTTENVKEHIKRLEEMRKYADLHGDKRTFLGAVAGVVMTAYAKKYALRQGLFVIEPSGETFNISSPR